MNGTSADQYRYWRTVGQIEMACRGPVPTLHAVLMRTVSDRALVASMRHHGGAA